MRPTIVGVLALAGALAALDIGVAQAKTCPNASTQTVNASPSYSYTRGCILSFDGTPIVYNLFEPLDPAPHSLYTILEGPGWGGAGATSPDENLIRAGYAELTWDPRGFGQSGGVAEVDSPSSEGRDVSALIDQVLTGRPEIAVDTLGADGQPRYSNDQPGSSTAGQPVVGMTGVSYGGGIEWATASFDKRVKAIAPGWSWNDLDYSLFPGHVIKLGWDELLFGAGLAEGGASHAQGDASGAPNGGDGGNTTGGYDPMIDYSEAEGTALGYPDQTTWAWFHQRSMAEYGAGPAGHVPDIPTLIIQGTVDTLFNLTDGWNSYIEIKAHHPLLPVKMIAFCGGHVSCPTGGSPTGAGYSDKASQSSPVAPGESAATYTERETIAWFDHYLRGENEAGASGDPSAMDAGDGMPRGARVVYQDQNGNFYPLSTFPTPSDPGPATYLSASFSGTLVSHGVPTGVGPAGEDAAVTDGATDADDPAQLTVPVVRTSAADLPIVGIGHVTATVTVDGNATELFFRLLDANTGEVVDLQTSPVRVDNLDLADDGTNAGPPAPQQVSLDLAGVSYDLPPHDLLELQVSTSTDSFAPNRGTAVVQLAAGNVSVPTLAPAG
jgi:ABC-2 type transport system ATP-binding protein